MAFVCFVFVAGCIDDEAKEYRENLLKVSKDMDHQSRAIKRALNTYSKVWEYSIEARAAIDPENMAYKSGLDQDIVEEYFKINSAGNIPNDFSTNVHSVKSYYKENKIGHAEKSFDEIKEKINELNDPPDNYEKVYNEVLDMYTYLGDYLDMALEPSGNIGEFNNKKEELLSDIKNKYKRVEAIMPNED